MQEVEVASGRDNAVVVANLLSFLGVPVFRIFNEATTSTE